MKNDFKKFAFTYAFRNLWRNSSRTLLTMTVVVISVAVSIVGQRYCAAAIGLWAEITRETGTGDIQIQHVNYNIDTTGLNKNNVITKNDNITSILDNDPNIVSYTPRLELEGIISSKSKTMYFLGTGVKPGSEELVSPRIFNKDKDQGTFISNENKSGIAIGKALAETLDLKLGDDITLLTQTFVGSMNADDFVVTGILNMPYEDASKRTIYLHIDKVHSLLKIDDSYSSYILRMQKDTKLREWKERNNEIFAAIDTKLQTWWEVYPIILKMELLWQSVIGIIVFLLFLSASISILNIIYILVSERTIEIGTLMALGAKRKDVQKLVMLEAFFIGFIGALIGVILASVVLFIMHSTGIPFENPLGTGFVFIHPEFSVYVSLIVFCLAIFMCVTSAYVPSKGASKLEPVVAFRGQIR